jgi:hypothetical protein
MKKHELQAELRSHGVTFSEKWCVTELRTLVQEHRPKKPVGIKGLSTMKLGELQALCHENSITYPEKATRGWLMLAIRDALEDQSETVFSVTKNRGLSFEEVFRTRPKWTSWCMSECDRVESHPEVLAFIRWVERQAKQGEPVTKAVPAEEPDEGPSEDENWEIPNRKGTGSRSSQVPPPKAKVKASPERSMSPAVKPPKRSVHHQKEDRMDGEASPEVHQQLMAAREMVRQLEEQVGFWEEPRPAARR